MGETGEISGGATEFRAGSAERIEMRETREPQRRPSQVQKALEQLRNHSDTERTIRDGKMLIQAETSDAQAFQRAEGLPEESEEVRAFRQVDQALDAIENNRVGDLEYRTVRQLRAFFREGKAHWEKNSHDAAQAGDNKAQQEAEKNRDIYQAVLSAINKKLPTPEALLPDYPQYDLKRIEPLLEALPQGELTLSAIEALYDSSAEDISDARDRAELEHLQWHTHKDIIHKATQKWRGVDMDERKPLLVTVNSDGEVKTDEVKLEEKTPVSTKKGISFILDPIEDADHLSGIDEFDILARDAKRGKEGVARLQKGDAILTLEEIGGLKLFISQLEEGLRRGVINKKYQTTLKKLGAFMKDKIDAAEQIVDPQPDPKTQQLTT